MFAKQAAVVSREQALRAAYLNGWYAASLACFFLQALCWARALRSVSLNVAYPFLSLTFVLNYSWAVLLFRDLMLAQGEQRAFSLTATVTLRRPNMPGLS